jgi:hypothetical protein
MTYQCPRCLSLRIDTKDQAKKAGGALGAIAGAVSGATGGPRRLDGAAPSGPTPLALAVLRGLIGSATGCAVGATFGEAIDSQVLDNLHCLNCSYTFSQKNL